MVGVTLKYYHFLLLLFIGFSSVAQSHLWSDVSVNKSSVYVGEPVQVTVSVYTSTWFTSGINPGNIKVNDAFTVYFRSLSTSKIINGKTYAGVQLFFNVFPYDDVDLTFPELEFIVETPNEGGFKGVKRTVKTKSKVIKVKSIPVDFNKNDWLVTSNMTVYENWTGNKTTVKVGDVLERKLTRNVSNTVAELIPPVSWDSIPNVSFYPTRSEVKSNKTKTAISATRTDGIRYLFEKEGVVEIPEKVMTWYNPSSKKLFKRTLKAHVINVLPNPDLGMLESVRDSLLISTLVKSEGIEKNSTKTILGLTVKQLIILTSCLILICYLVFKIGSKIIVVLKQKMLAYLNSEKYYFDKFVKSIKKGDSKQQMNALYSWISKLNLQESTVTYFVSKYGSKELFQQLATLESEHSKLLKPNEWFKARKQYLKNKDFNTKSKDWVNP